MEPRGGGAEPEQCPRNTSDSTNKHVPLVLACKDGDGASLLDRRSSERSSMELGTSRSVTLRYGHQQKSISKPFPNRDIFTITIFIRQHLLLKSWKNDVVKKT